MTDEPHPIYVCMSKLCDPQSRDLACIRPFYFRGHTIAVEMGRTGLLAVRGKYANSLKLDDAKTKRLTEYLQKPVGSAASFKQLVEWAGDPNWEERCLNCNSGKVQCSTCKGSGKGTNICGECSHSHECVCEDCEGKKVCDCRACEGSGYAGEPRQSWVSTRSDGKLLVDRLRFARLFDALPEPMRLVDSVEIGVDVKGQCVSVQGENWYAFLMAMRHEEGEEAPTLELA